MVIKVLGLMDHPVRMRTMHAGSAILGRAGPPNTEGGRLAADQDGCRWES
jgi:hypothetical protein